MSDQIEMPEEFTAPRGAGPQLRLAREQLGLSVADVAARTRISARHITDLEAGDFAAFSSRTYAIGFARTVAKAVGLDGEVIAGQVRGALNALQPAPRVAEGYETSDPARVPSRPLVWFSALAGGLLLAGLFVAWRTMFSPAAELPSLVAPEEVAQVAGPAAPSDQPSAVASGAVVFTATDDQVWVRFYDASGQRLMEKDLVRGESYTVPANANGPMVRTARPEALTITVGGRPVPPLATEMMIVRDVKVDAASLAARPAVAVAAAAPSAAPSVAAAIAAPLRQVPLSARARPRGAAATARAASDTRSQPSAQAARRSQDAAAANAASAVAAETATTPDEAPAAPQPEAAAPAEPAAE